MPALHMNQHHLMKPAGPLGASGALRGAAPSRPAARPGSSGLAPRRGVGCIGSARRR